MRVLLAGGGTGGHINPALAIASIIKSHDENSEFLFAGTPFGMEAKLIPAEGYDFAKIKVRGFQRQIRIKNVYRNCQAACYLMSAGNRAKKIIKDFNPDVVIGTGGYVSGPILLKAAKMGIPTAIHEQNAFPGVTTRLLTKNVDRVMLTVKEAAEYFNGDVNYTVTGLPVRAGIQSKTRREARQELGLDDSFCILSFGGSLGAGCINTVAEKIIEWHSKNDLKINHIHGYGGMGKKTFVEGLTAKGVDINKPNLRISEYINNMDACMAAADLIICRSGASTLAEIETMGRASILIPSPIVAGNHQYHNARVLEKAGAAILIEQKDIDKVDIIAKIEELYNNPDKVDVMSKNASDLAITDTNERIYKIISEIARKS